MRLSGGVPGVGWLTGWGKERSGAKTLGRFFLGISGTSKATPANSSQLSGTLDHSLRTTNALGHAFAYPRAEQKTPQHYNQINSR
jgi:hypothetical protein